MDKGEEETRLLVKYLLKLGNNQMGVHHTILLLYVLTFPITFLILNIFLEVSGL